MSQSARDERRRAGASIRVPFVRRCRIALEGGPETAAFIVNINVLGVYIAYDAIPPLGRSVTCRFQPPGTERELATEGVVAWTNPVQEHPVHSLPPGFGLAFRRLSDDARIRIERIVADYVERQASRV